LIQFPFIEVLLIKVAATAEGKLATDSLYRHTSRVVTLSEQAHAAQQGSPVYMKKPAVLYQFGAGSVASSKWSLSWGKRAFDVSCVLLTLPLLLPALLIVALAVKLTSSGPAFFTQQRIGRKGRAFTILKFRTMEHARKGTHRSVTTAANQQFTPIGPFLRRWKLDEVPQLLNVLKGDMSLVGPRPKLPEHQIATLHWRPGITGAATFAFAREEEFLAGVPAHQLDGYYHRTILPAKYKLDVDYMRRASFRSDMKLLVDTFLRRWGNCPIQNLLTDFEQEARMGKLKGPVSAPSPSYVLSFDGAESVVSGD